MNSDAELRDLRIPSGRRRRFALYAVLALLAVVLVIDGVVVLFGLRQSMSDLRAALNSSHAALADSRFDDGAASLEEARQAAERSHDLMTHPAYRLGSIVPTVRDDLQALSSMRDAGDLATEAGLRITGSVEDLGVDKRSVLRELYSHGRVNLDALTVTSGGIERAHILIQDARDALDDAVVPSNASLRSHLTAARAAVVDAARTVERAASFLEIVPGLFGSDGPRAYLLAFQALSEARGTGGVIGLYGVVEAFDGRMRLTEVGPYTELEIDEPVTAPQWFTTRYEQFRSLRQWSQANLSPHFPTVAEVLLQMYEVDSGRTLDGVISVDPLALAQILEATGPVEVAELGGTINGANAAEILLHDSYTEIRDTGTQTLGLTKLIEEVWADLYRGDAAGVALATGLAEAADTRHLMLYLSDEESATRLESLGLDGGFEPTRSNLQMIVHNNASANKTDYFLRAKQATQIRLTKDDVVEVSTDMTVRNDAPAGPPSVLLGPGVRGDRPGMNRMYLNFVLPKGAKSVAMEVDGRSSFSLRAEEKGHPVVWGVVELEPGEQHTMTARYQLPFVGETIPFSITLVPQPLIRPVPFRVKFTDDEGRDIDVTMDAPDTDTARNAVTGLLSRSVTVRATFNR